MKFLMIGILVLIPTLANAQLKNIANKNDTNKPINQQSITGDVNSFVDKFYSATVEDLKSAQAYAEFGNDQAAVDCYAEWLSQVENLTKLRELYPDTGNIQVITAFQKARNLVKRLDTDSPLRRACAALALDAKQDIKQLITGIVTGVALRALMVP